MEQNLPFTPEQIKRLAPIYYTVKEAEKVFATENTSFEWMAALVDGVIKSEFADTEMQLTMLSASMVITTMRSAYMTAKKAEHKQAIQEVAKEEVKDIVMTALYLAAARAVKV